MPVPAHPAFSVRIIDAVAFLLFAVSSETTTSVMKLNGMEMMPGLLSGMGASSGFSPYRVYNSGEKAINPSEATMPTTMEAAMPLAVVRFQNSSMTIAGRLAERPPQTPGPPGR